MCLRRCSTARRSFSNRRGCYIEAVPTAKQLFIGAAVTLALLGAGGLFFMYHRTVAPQPLRLPDGKLDQTGEASKWRERIAQLGGAEAYAEFARYTKILNPGDMHTLAHAFGAALYAAEGFKSVGVCGELYSYGCLHEMLKRTISEEGASQFVSFAETCETSIGRVHPCEHAVGHGLLTNLGYDKTSLLKALDLCASRYSDDPMNGCFGGALMEYNLYTSLALPTSARPKENDSWYSPCDDMPEAYERSCYYWLPQWWIVYLPEHPEEFGGKEPSGDDLFVKTGELCGTLPTAQYRRDCFQRLGQLIANTEYRTDEAIRICGIATKTDLQNMFCRSYAAYMLTHQLPAESPTGLPVCKGLQGDALTVCRAYGNKEFYTPNDMELPASLQNAS